MIAVIASLFVQSSPKGKSIQGLWEQLRIVADDSTLRLKLERICLQALGNTWYLARSKSYDEHLAEDSLQFFDICSIPKISKDQPDGVNNIRFCSDLTHADPIILSDKCFSGKLLNCCIK